MTENPKALNILREPIHRLIGYCNSATFLESDSRLKEWAQELVKLATSLETAWNKAMGGSNEKAK
jgi:hypothetical protein